MSINNTELHEPRLQWVLADGDLKNVSIFSELPPKSRPKVYCPVCERQVTLKLGQKRVHHFAHRPEDICPATQPETALHLNCKFHIYQLLKGATEVHTETSCSRCSRQRSELWKQDWDEVEVEYRMDSLRPDIALLKNGVVIGAIEIYVTHAVHDEKAQLFKNQGIAWVEVYGSAEIYEGDDTWNVSKPLPTWNQYPPPRPWTCDACLKAQAQAEYKYNNRVEIIFARMIDFYFPSGKKYREAYYVKQKFTNGEVTRLWIEDEHRTVIADERGPITEASKHRLNQKFKQRQEAIKRSAAIVDDAMKWTPWLPGQRFVPRDIDRFPFRYIWQPEEHKWHSTRRAGW